MVLLCFLPVKPAPAGKGIALFLAEQESCRSPGGITPARQDKGKSNIPFHPMPFHPWRASAAGDVHALLPWLTRPHGLGHSEIPHFQDFKFKKKTTI